MASKYDFYWQNRLDELKKILNEAYQKGESSCLDVSGIINLGHRKNWHGVVKVSPEGIQKGEMAHARSLGKVLWYSGLLDSFGDFSYLLTISNGLELVARRMEQDKEVPNAFTELNSINHKNEAEKRLITILDQVPTKTWEQVVNEEPEWKVMRPFLNKYGFGPFAVLMLATGLNDYMLSGKAEKAYWPPLGEILSSSPVPKTRKELYYTLAPFYRNERYNEQKIDRLKRFLFSGLAEMLWTANPSEASRIFPYIWRKLADTMGQNPHAKTITFAMKCLGLSLIMAGEYNFDFSQVPIPVDYRVVRFTKSTGLGESDTEEKVRQTWNRVLSGLQESKPYLTMIHLDSLVWQIATMNEKQMQDYFALLGNPMVGRQLCDFMKEGKENTRYKDSTARLNQS